ncbi:MAG: hypothetical protein ABI698_02055, partial [bacterium]
PPGAAAPPSMKTVPRTVWSWKLALLFPVLLASIGCRGDKRVRVYVPETYYGWVRIEYGVVGAPKLSEASFIQGQPGLMQTSSELDRASANNEIYYGTTMEVRPVASDMIHGRVSSLNVVKPDGSPFEKQFTTFFLGPSELYEKHKKEIEQFRKNKDEYIIPGLEELPRVGNIRP